MILRAQTSPKSRRFTRPTRGVGWQPQDPLDQKLVDALMRLDPGDGSVEQAILVDDLGLVMAKTPGASWCDEHAALAAVALSLAARTPSANGRVEGLTLHLARGRMLELRPIRHKDYQLVALCRRPLEPLRSSRVARELRLAFGDTE